MQLAGRVALITGGASGIGLATASAFAAEGARVVLADLREDDAHRVAAELGEGHNAIGVDVADETSVNAMIKEGLQRHGRIDILVNSAGIADAFVPTVDQSVAHWRRLIDIHMTGTYMVSKSVAPSMIQAGAGVILNLNSIAGVLGLPVRTAYSAAKAGIGMMTRVLGCEWGPHGIRVNAIAPGYILTPMTQTLIDEGRIDVGRIRRRTPMGVLGTPEDIADAMVFLASDRAKFITGVTLTVDGGYCAFGAPSDAFDHVE